MKQGVSGSWKQRILDPVLNRCTHVLPCFYISLFFSTIKIESILTDMNSSRASSKSSGVYSLTEAQQMRAQEIREQRRALRERDGSKPPSMRFGRRIDSNTTATSAPRSTSRPTAVASNLSTSRVFCSRPGSSRQASCRTSPTSSAAPPRSACTSPGIDRASLDVQLSIARPLPLPSAPVSQRATPQRSRPESVCLSPVAERSPSSMRKVLADSFDVSDIRPSGRFELPRPTRSTAHLMSIITATAPSEQLNLAEQTLAPTIPPIAMTSSSSSDRQDLLTTGSRPSLFAQPRPTPRSSTIIADLIAAARALEDSQPDDEKKNFSASSLLNVQPGAVPIAASPAKAPEVVGGTGRRSSQRLGRCSVVLSDVVVSPCSDVFTGEHENEEDVKAYTEKPLDLSAVEVEEEAEQILDMSNENDDFIPVAEGKAGQADDDVSREQAASESVVPPSEAFFDCRSSFATPALGLPTAMQSPAMQTLTTQFEELKQLASHVIGHPRAASANRPRIDDDDDGDDDDASPRRRSSSIQRLIDSAGSTPHPHTPVPSAPRPFLTSNPIRSFAASRSTTCETGCQTDGKQKRSRSNTSPLSAEASVGVTDERRMTHRKSEIEKLLDACPEDIRAEISPHASGGACANEASELSVAERVAARPRAVNYDYTYWERDLVMRTRKSSGAAAPRASGNSKKLPPPPRVRVAPQPAAPLDDPSLDPENRGRPTKKSRVEPTRKNAGGFRKDQPAPGRKRN